MRLIDADALYEKANGLSWRGRSVIQHALRVSPTIEAEPVRYALWEECDWVEFDGFECVRYPKKGRVCTNCRNAFKKEFVDDRRVRFCPHCGFKMASGAKSEEMTDLLADFSEDTDLEHMTRFAVLQAFKNK